MPSTGPANLPALGKPIEFKDGSEGIQLPGPRVLARGGILDSDGKIITFWYR